METRRRQSPKQKDSSLVQMEQWLSRIGYEVRDLDRLNMVHVAGTKGKSTTCAFVSSILSSNQSAHRIPRKVGLYTSPHLVHVRERIQIDSQPITEPDFARYFFEVWDSLNRGIAEEYPEGSNSSRMPNYFRFLTLMSFHVFLQEGVDVAVCEVGIGGTWDSTNIVEVPAVTGITSLGIDHVAQLGDTIEEIAWHKSGIFKKDCPAFMVEQGKAATEVVKLRATDLGASSLQEVGENPALLQTNILPNAAYQRKNASLALCLADTVLQKLGQDAFSFSSGVPSVVTSGLETSLRGRCQIKQLENGIWFLDGAHTADSIKVACTWFSEETRKRGPCSRILMFNQESRADAVIWLRDLGRTLQKDGVSFEHAVFCTNVTRRTGYDRELINRNRDPGQKTLQDTQKAFKLAWKGINSDSSKAHVVGTIEDAIDFVKDFARKEQEIQVFVTGSLHLIGGTLSVLEGVRTSDTS